MLNPEAPCYTGPAMKSHALNRLGREKSPYLLQHARNPVDWFPRGPEAFEKAKKENKLIFLSIGYSTCHWCHVMEKESFENEEVAALLNESFVSVKVDREERPDIDHIYMAAVQAMTGSGGWPLSVFLTPDAKPVTGGTYFPPEDRWGRAGMKTILPKLAATWEKEPEKMKEAGGQLAQLLTPKPSGKSGEVAYAEIMTKAFTQLASGFDSARGGFGGAPKFPRSHELSFLLRYGQRHSDPHAIEMVEKTLEEMAKGGIYDHLGGGFHRYSTDAQWLVPHFEKMLYDQAILVRTYLEAYQTTHVEFYADVARDILNYVMRDMTDKGGAFYSAEDADTEGEEGKFYVWRPEEISGILGSEEARIFSGIYGVTDEGNFEHATSILNLSKTIPELVQENPSVPDLAAKLEKMRQKLFEERAKRPAPYKDDKILTAWNGLMISAFSLAAQVLNEPRYAQAAERAAGFILKNMTKDGRLLRRSRDNESAIPAFQDDYANLALALLDLYEADFQVRWLEEAKRLTDEMLRLFWDKEAGGFFFAAEDNEKLIVPTKEYYDGAVPSGNSVAVLLLLRLWRMTGNADYEKKARETVLSNADSLAHYPVAYPQLLIALDFALGPTFELVLAGGETEPVFREMLGEVHKDFYPRKVLLHHPAGPEASKIRGLADFITMQTAVDSKATAYFCENHVCRLPVSDKGGLEKLLRAFQGEKKN